MITVTFSGDPGELIELFSSNGFLKAVSMHVKGKVKVEEKKPEEVPVTNPTVEQPTITKEQMRHALQEYCVRMRSRYDGIENYDTREMVITLIRQLTDGEADNTSKISKAEHFTLLYNAAISDTIPDAYKNIVGSK